MALAFVSGPCGMTKRDFLASHNLAKAGTRGRFSTKAVEFLAAAEAAGVTFDEPVKATPVRKPVEPVTASEVKAADKPETVAEATSSKWTAPAILANEVFRDHETHWAITEGSGGSSVLRVGFSQCFSDSCGGRSVKFCPHDEPTPPAGAIYIGPDKSEVLV